VMGMIWSSVDERACLSLSFIDDKRHVIYAVFFFFLKDDFFSLCSSNLSSSRFFYGHIDGQFALVG